MTKRKYHPAQCQESLPHIARRVEKLRRIVVVGDPLFWRVALRKVACELEKPVAEPRDPPKPPETQRFLSPEKEDN